MDTTATELVTAVARAADAPLPDTSEVQKYLDLAKTAMLTASAPALAALFLGIIVTQLVKGMCERLMPHRMGENDGGLRVGEVWALSFVATLIGFWGLCKGFGVPYRGENFALAVAAGFFAPFVAGLFKRFGWDLDRLPLVGSPSVRSAAHLPPDVDPGA